MLRQSLSEALRQATRDRDERSVKTIRLIMAAIKDRDIAARTAHAGSDGQTDDDIRGLLQTMIKQRRESIDMYEQGGRLDLAEGEREEIRVIERFLPRQMSQAEVAEAVDGVIDELGAEGLKDMGKVMAELRSRYAGSMDFGKAGAVAKQRLA